MYVFAPAKCRLCPVPLADGLSRVMLAVLNGALLHARLRSAGEDDLVLRNRCSLERPLFGEGRLLVAGR